MIGRNFNVFTLIIDRLGMQEISKYIEDLKKLFVGAHKMFTKLEHTVDCITSFSIFERLKVI